MENNEKKSVLSGILALPWAIIELVGDVAASVFFYCAAMFSVFAGATGFAMDSMNASAEAIKEVGGKNLRHAWSVFMGSGLGYITYKGTRYKFYSLANAPMARRVRGISGYDEIEGTVMKAATVTRIVEKDDFKTERVEMIEEPGTLSDVPIPVSLRGYCLAHPFKTWHARPDMHAGLIRVGIVIAAMAALIYFFVPLMF